MFRSDGVHWVLMCSLKIFKEMTNDKVSRDLRTKCLIANVILFKVRISPPSIIL